MIEMKEYMNQIKLWKEMKNMENVMKKMLL